MKAQAHCCLIYAQASNRGNYSQGGKRINHQHRVQLQNHAQTMKIKKNITRLPNTCELHRH